MLAAVIGVAVVIAARLRGEINVPGYTATVLVLLFFGGLTALGLGIVGQYLWLCLQNTRNRPSFIIRSTTESQPAKQPGLTSKN